MISTNLKIQKLLEKYKNIALLNKIDSTLEWDTNVNLPEKASEGRADQVAYLADIITDKWLETDFKDLVEILYDDKEEFSQEEKAIIRNVYQEGKYYFKVPKEIIIEKEKTTSEAFMVWQEAKKENNFLEFLPYFKKIVNINQVIADHLGYKDHPYDAMLDFFEPGLTTDFVEKQFSNIQPFLTEMLTKIQSSPNYKIDDYLISGGLNYPQTSQKNLAINLLKKMNFDFDAGRLDESSHPITFTLDAQDIRITVLYHEPDFRDAFTSAMHEGGHALYEQNINPEYDNTPLEGGVTFSIHEALSRFWENIVGRNPEFITFMTPELVNFFPEQLDKVESQTIIRLLNQVKPSFIRVDSDEITYNLHIILRFEIERDLITGKIRAEDVPEIWNSKMKKYLGIVPDTDRDGCLQDIHWALGEFGYFPSYAIGNLYAAQFLAAIKKEINFSDSLEKGELGTVLSWLDDHIHKYGSLYYPDELIKISTGENLNPEYYKKYLTQKYSKIYQL